MGEYTLLSARQAKETESRYVSLSSSVCPQTNTGRAGLLLRLRGRSRGRGSELGGRRRGRGLTARGQGRQGERGRRERRRSGCGEQEKRCRATSVLRSPTLLRHVSRLSGGDITTHPPFAPSSLPTTTILLPRPATRHSSRTHVVHLWRPLVLLHTLSLSHSLSLSLSVLSPFIPIPAALSLYTTRRVTTIASTTTTAPRYGPSSHALPSTPFLQSSRPCTPFRPALTISNQR